MQNIFCKRKSFQTDVDLKNLSLKKSKVKALKFRNNFTYYGEDCEWVDFATVSILSYYENLILKQLCR